MRCRSGIKSASPARYNRRRRPARRCGRRPAGRGHRRRGSRAADPGARLLAAAWPAASPAQIYSWRDAGGTLVLSDHPRRAPARPDVRRPADRGFDPDHAVQDRRRPRRLSTSSSRSMPRPTGTARPGAGGHPGRVGLQSTCGVAQGRDGADAADAGHGTRSRREQPVRSRGEHPRRFGVPAAAARAVRQQRGTCAGGLQRRPRGRSNRYGQRVPPYRETRGYVQKVKNKTALGTARRTDHLPCRRNRRRRAAIPLHTRRNPNPVPTRSCRDADGAPSNTPRSPLSPRRPSGIPGMLRSAPGWCPRSRTGLGQVGDPGV